MNKQINLRPHKLDIDNQVKFVWYQNMSNKSFDYHMSRIYMNIIGIKCCSSNNLEHMRMLGYLFCLMHMMCTRCLNYYKYCIGNCKKHIVHFSHMFLGYMNIKIHSSLMDMMYNQFQQNRFNTMLSISNKQQFHYHNIQQGISNQELTLDQLRIQYNMIMKCICYN